jgi:hypothetical protein
VGIGASIFLIAVGAILTFALEVEVGGLDLDVVGWILMAAGVLGLVLTTMVWGPRRRALVSRRPGAYTVEERTEVGPPDTY